MSTRHQKAISEAMRLVEAGSPHRAWEILEQAHGGFGAEGVPLGLLEAMAALAWHHLSDPARVSGLFEKHGRCLSSSPVARRIAGELWRNTLQRCVLLCDLGFRCAARELLLSRAEVLRPFGTTAEPSHLEEFFLEHLSSPAYRRLRRLLREEVSRNMAGGASSAASYREALLHEVERRMKEAEKGFLASTPVVNAAYEKLQSSLDAFLEFEELIAGVERCVRSYLEYRSELSAGRVEEVKDFLASFLPGGMRERLVTPGYNRVEARRLELDDALDEYLGRWYPRASAESA